MFYRPETGHGLPHNPFNAIVSPRPIGWISTVSAQGVGNLSPFSFFNLLCQRPAIVAFACETRNHTLANCEETGEFVHNLASQSLAEMMNQSSANYPAEVDEMRYLGIESAPCVNVRPMRVAQSPASLECKVTEIRSLATLAGGKGRSVVVFGQVVGVHIRHDCLEDGIFQTTRALPMTRAGRDDYSVMDRAFSLPRPKL